jgi:hypothetical protein
MSLPWRFLITFIPEGNPHPKMAQVAAVAREEYNEVQEL